MNGPRLKECLWKPQAVLGPHLSLLTPHDATRSCVLAYAKTEQSPARPPVSPRPWAKKRFHKQRFSLILACFC